jgi:hypothetical protein
MRQATVVLLLLICASSNAATRRTPNFIVETAEQHDADEFAQLAEKYRKELAVTWLGEEMPTWKDPCRLVIYVTGGGSGGATSFQFGENIYQEMQIQGARDRLKASVLPHEVTHTVFAHHFRQPVPRWADEGGSVFGEDTPEKERFHKLCVTLLNDGKAYKLSGLFKLNEYPKDVMCLYSQGYSVTDYLISLKGRQEFLNFVSSGMQNGWDAACKTYSFGSVDELETAWIEHLRGRTFKH